MQLLITLALLLAVTMAVPQGRFFGGFGRPVVGLRPIGGGFGGLGGGGLGGFGGLGGLGGLGFGKIKFSSQ